MARKRRKKSKRLIQIGLVVLVLAVSGLMAWRFLNNDDAKTAPINNNPAAQSQPEPQPVGWRPAAGSMQAVIENWAKTHRGAYSIVITNPTDGTVLASWGADTEYFTASIYKLYVAYAGYQKIDDGTYSLSDPYLSGYTRGQCLDAMIRDSYSPCAEKMWAELGKQNLTSQMQALGLTGTSLVNLDTTASDASIILGRIWRGEGLSGASRTAFLTSMKEQENLYRRGLPTGFTNATVYNKVGWNELVEWHDTAIVDFGDGRVITVSALTKNAGIANVVDLGRTIQANLPQ